MKAITPISSFDERMRDYRKECRRFYYVAIPAALLVLVASLASYYALDAVLGPLRSDWRVVALGIALGVVVMPIYVMRPQRPSHEDVLRDQAIRRAAGLDDTVSN